MKNHMKAPNSPKKITWIIGLLLGIAGIISHYMHVEWLSKHSFICLMAGFLVLAAGTTFRKL
jgi:hypothetical protein